MAADPPSLATAIQVLEQNEPDKEILNLFALKLNNAQVESLAQALKTNTTITLLILGNSGFGDPGAIALAEALSSNTTLASLFLGDNKIGDEGSKAFGQLLTTNTTLRCLYLWRNEIHGAGAKFIADGLAKNNTLTTLDLGWNDIRLGALDLAIGLRLNTSLRVLHFHSNQVDDDGAVALADAIRVHPTLEVLNLAGNSIRDAGAQALADSLKVNPHITTLAGSSSSTAATSEIQEYIDRNKWNNKMRRATILQILLPVLCPPPKPALSTLAAPSAESTPASTSQ